MTTFVGFSTINQYKKFTLVDMELIKRDLLNAFNIQQGQLVGRPGYGTLLWNYLFESQLQDTTDAISQEIQRVAGGDPRIYLPSNPEIFPQENGILIQLEIQFVQGQTSQLLSIFFDQQTRNASYV
jgi:phage baseplate assembly protein W